MTNDEIRGLLLDLCEIALPAYEEHDLPDLREPLKMLRRPDWYDSHPRAGGLAFEANKATNRQLGYPHPLRRIPMAIQTIAGWWPSHAREALGYIAESGVLPLDATSLGLIHAVRCGEWEAWGPLADALEEQGLDLPSRRTTETKG